MFYIAYYRVSTARQGKSGLGLDAQKRTVQDFIKSDKRHDLVKAYIEVESGRSNTRIELTRALEHCKKVGATLLIAKLDRLSRNVSFIFALRDSGVPFRALDLPDANTLTIGIFAVVAQHEREIISNRIKDALAAKKRRGFELGTPANLTRKAIKKGLKARMDNANNDPNNRRAFEVIKHLRKDGLTFRAIADKLNDLGYRTRRNNTFFSSTVDSLFKRFTKLNNAK